MTLPKSVLSLWVTQNCYCGTNFQFCFSNCFFISLSKWNGFCRSKSHPPSPHLLPPVLLDCFLLSLLTSSGTGCEEQFTPCSSWLLPATGCSGLMLGCMKGKFEQDRVSVASLTICLVQDEPQLLLERGLTAVAHLVQLFPPTDSVPVSAVSQNNMTTLLNDGCSQTQTWLSGPQRHHCSSFLLIPHTHFCLPRHKPECTRMDYGLPETGRL